MISLIATIFYWVLFAFIALMWIRFVVDFVRVIRREWRPRGFVLIVCNVCYAVTDPPLRLIRRVMKPVRFGDVMIDFGWTIVLLVAVILMYTTQAFM